MHWLIALLLLFVARAGALEIQHANHGFSLQLPAGWIELGPEQMRELRGRDPEELRVPIEGIVHVFQTDRANEPLTPPLVHVRVENTARLPDLFVRQLLMTNEPSALIRQLLLRGGINSYLRDVRFDTNRMVILIDSSHDTPKGRDRVLSRLFFTEQGVIGVNAVAPEAEFGSWAATFGQILDSFVVPENLRYKVRDLDLSGGWRDWAVLLGAMGGLLVVALGWVYWSRIRGPSTLEY
jgi:hypothetical protein